MKFEDLVGEDFAYYEVVIQVFPSYGLNQLLLSINVSPQEINVGTDRSHSSNRASQGPTIRCMWKHHKAWVLGHWCTCCGSGIGV